MKRQFADRYAELEAWHWWFRGRQRILETILRRELGHRTSLSIASVGCGPASGLSWLLPFAAPAGLVIGIDADAGQKNEGGGPIPYAVGRLEAIPARSSSMDVVLALDVYEHLEDDAAGVRESIRLIRPGGLLLATVPAFPSLWGEQDVVSHHLRRYTRRSLANIFRRAGASSPRIEYFNFFLFPPIALMRWCRRLAGRMDESRSDFEDNQPGRVNDLLGAVFAAERHCFGRIPFPFGVSLLAIARI